MENNVSTISASEDSWQSQVKCKESDSDSNTFEDDQSNGKIKPEVELKEESGGLIYKTDTQGNLKLVCSGLTVQSINSEVCDTSLNDISSSQFDDCPEQLKNDYIQTKLIETENDLIKSEDDVDISIDTSEDVARYSSNFSPCSPSILTYQSQEQFQLPTNSYPDLNLQWSHVKGLPEGLNQFFKKHFDNINDGGCTEVSCERSQKKTSPSLQSPDPMSLGATCLKPTKLAPIANSSTHFKEIDKEGLLYLQALSNDICDNKSDSRKRGTCSKPQEMSEAEKKRLYRQRIKETNPELWQTIKRRDAAQKRKKRAHRQMIAREMQTQLELESSNLGNVHGLYLDALKERYPDLWEQLLQTVPEVRNRIDHKSRGAKSVTAYKDIIAAEKKRLYREKIKREKPELWERQKARDAQRRSIQRLMSNPKRMPALDVKSEVSDHALLSEEKELTYLQNLEVEQTNFVSNQTLSCDLTPLQPVFTPETNYGDIHTNAPTVINEPVCALICDESEYRKSCVKHEDNPSSTQSKMLWFWNDTPDFSKNRSHIPENEAKSLKDKCSLDESSDCLTKDNFKKKKHIKLEKERIDS